jgi:hypothetical protein
MAVGVAAAMPADSGFDRDLVAGPMDSLSEYAELAEHVVVDDDE